MINSKIKKLLTVLFQSSQELKAENIMALDLKTISSYADYILIASGNSDRQVKSIVDHMVEEAHKKCVVSPLGIEGSDTGSWILVDFGDIVCHVFLSDVRELYHLEDMWPQIRPMNESQLEASLGLEPKLAQKLVSPTLKKPTKKIAKTAAKKTTRKKADPIVKKSTKKIKTTSAKKVKKAVVKKPTKKIVRKKTKK